MDAATILHADLDSFYASVEQLLDPSLLGKPIAVGGGVVLAASYEAKRFGVHGGMPGKRAQELCPDLIFVDGHFEQYQALGDAAIKVLGDYTPLVERISIDEAFADVAGTAHLFGPPAAVAQAIRARVRAELGHERCRLGIGGRATGPSGLPRSLHEAQLALRIQRATGSDEAAVEFGELGVYRLLADVREPTDVEQFARQWLGPLIDYDARKGSSDLVTTLSRYLENGGNYEATARSLLLHRSTLKYRVQRIREILQLDINDPDTRFNLQLATRAWHTLHSLRGKPA